MSLPLQAAAEEAHDAQGALRWTAFAIGRDVRCVVAILKKALALLAVLLYATMPLTLSRFFWLRQCR